MPLIKLTGADGLDAFGNERIRATIRSEEIGAVVLLSSQTGVDAVAVHFKSGEMIAFNTTSDAQSAALFAKIEGAI